MPRNTSTSITDPSEPTIQQNSGFENDPLPNQIQSELFSSVARGMSYAEVSSIIGWEGVLIYESNIDDGGEVIQTKVYRWNADDLHLDNIASDEPTRKNNIDPNKSLILEFQNDVLIELDFSNQNLY